jgi:hypothetical protein
MLDRRGTIYIEYLITVIPVLAFFVATWQFIELATADLVLRRAASAAARAAAVVLPDDPLFYRGENGPDAKKMEDVELAAKEILGTMCVPGIATVPSGFTDADVSVSPDRTPGEPITATVTAQFHCAMGWASMVCGGRGTRQLVAKATYAYQGAHYHYAGEASGPVTNGGGSW